MSRTPPRPVTASILATTVGALVLGACGTTTHAGRSEAPQASVRSTTLPGENRPPVTIGDKNFTEEFVLGQLYKQALEAQGFTTSINRNIGPTEVTIQALQSGRIDMYPEYLGTWNATVAGDLRRHATVRSAYAAGQTYAHAHGLELLRRTPFSDVDAIGVTLAYAQQNRLRTIGDLARLAPTVTLGGPPQFQQSPTGLPGIEQSYGVVGAVFKALAVGGQYEALDQGSVQAADVSSTDGELLSGRYALLGDPKRLFGWGNVVPVVPSRVLVAEGPGFAATINAVSALLSTQAIRRLNADVDILHQDPALAAKQFLQAAGLVAPG